jgi:lysophospholipase L1-like esterase
MTKGVIKLDDTSIWIIVAIVAAIIFFLRKKSDKKTTKTCTIMAGVNDVYHLEKAVPFDETMANFTAMISLVKSKDYIPVVGIFPSTRSYVAGTQEQATQTDAIRNAQIEYCQQNSITMIDFRLALTDIKYLTDDLLHPNLDGYHRMGDVAVQILSLLKPSSVLAFGDSITSGYPYTDNCPPEELDSASWTAVVREYFGVPVSNQGIGGQTTREILLRMKIYLQA